MKLWPLMLLTTVASRESPNNWHISSSRFTKSYELNKIRCRNFLQRMTPSEQIMEWSLEFPVELPTWWLSEREGWISALQEAFSFLKVAIISVHNRNLSLGGKESCLFLHWIVANVLMGGGGAKSQLMGIDVSLKRVGGPRPWTLTAHRELAVFLNPWKTDPLREKNRKKTRNSCSLSL